MSTSFDPKRSTVQDDKLAEFVNLQLSGDLTEIPGIGPAAVKTLADQGVSTSFGLIGKYLMFKEEGVECVEHCDRFYLWLKAIGINSNRGSIVHSIAERLDQQFPGIYDGSLYE
mmetsp:Transcript_14373/g.23788  ORF Transcript_14373/g.23788 Transcript_14373/m.23788 type:complete len:114 (-) Transcript_14373:193-534(-)